MSDLIFTVYKNQRETTPIATIKGNWEKVFKELVSPRKGIKDVNLCLFGAYDLDVGGSRNDMSVTQVTALVLDYDKNPVPIEQIDLPFLHFRYETTSSIPGARRYRVVVPLENPIVGENLGQLLKEALTSLFEYAPTQGFDVGSGDLSRAYYWMTPEREYYPKQIEPLPFFKPTFGDSSIFDELKELAKKSKSNGRNDTLKAQASKALFLGKSIETVALEILTYDKQYHTPPLFEDAKEWSDRNTPSVRSVLFTSRIYSSISSKIEFAQANPEEVKLDEFEAHTESLGNFPESMYKRAPQHIQEITEYIYANVPKRSYAYAFAGAICLMSIVYGLGRRTKRIYPNLNMFLVGPSSAGKSVIFHPMRAILKSLALSGYSIVPSQSIVAVGRQLKKYGGRGYWLWDECGGALSAGTGKTAQAHQVEFASCLNTLWDNSGERSDIRAYADEKREQVSFDNTFFTILGTCTEAEMLGLITPGRMASGFAPRLLSINPAQESEYVRNWNPSDSKPTEIIERLCSIDGIKDSSAYQLENSQTIKLTPEASEMFDDFSEKQKTAAWGKAGVNALKIALCLADDSITADTMQLSLDIVSHSVDYAESLANLSESTEASRPLIRKRQQSSYDNLMVALHKAQIPMTFEEIAKEAKISIRTVKSFMPFLVSSGEILVKKEGATTKKINKYFLKKS